MQPKYAVAPAFWLIHCATRMLFIVAPPAMYSTSKFLIRSCAQPSHSSGAAAPQRGRGAHVVDLQLVVVAAVRRAGQHAIARAARGGAMVPCR